MNLVIIGGFLPYPATAGNRIRTLNLMLRLARRHQIRYVGTRNTDRSEGAEALAFLGDHGIKAIEVEHTVASKSGPGFYARLAANLVSNQPYSVASFASTAMSRTISELDRGGQIDLWQAEWSGAFASLDGLVKAKTLIMAHNVETQIWERTAEAETNPIKQAYMKLQARKFASFERQAFRRADRVVTVTEADAALVRDRFGANHVDVVDNGIDRAFFEAVTPARDPLEILFLGSLDWRPNLDALALLLDRIFPTVRALEPSARLTIVGRTPPLALERRVAETEGATLIANVPDVRPYLGRAGVLAVPLRIGGGSRLKILEALATGLPVVSTTVGAEGLELKDGEDLDIVDDPDAFATRLVDTIRSPQHAQAMAARGRQFVLERYDWDALAALLERSWERCMEDRCVKL